MNFNGGSRVEERVVAPISDTVFRVAALTSVVRVTRAPRACYIPVRSTKIFLHGTEAGSTIFLSCSIVASCRVE